MPLDRLRASDASALRAAVGNHGTARRLGGPATPIQMRPLAGWRAKLEALATAEDRVDESAEIHRRAADGVAGPGGALPHLDRLTPMFGAETLRGVAAHTGAVAEAACRDLGAEAYATGDRIAFADRHPSLHTTAHEVAHVLQQRRGVRPEGGLGRAGDVHERQADRVADAVTRRRPATGLLPDAPARAPAGGVAVQRLMSRDQLVAQAGQPTPHTSYFGVRKEKSKRYRALLDALANYDALSALTVPEVRSARYIPSGERLEEALQAVQAACDAFIARYDHGEARDATERARLPHVKALRRDTVTEGWLIGRAHDPANAGRVWKDAIPQDERDRMLVSTDAMIRSLDDDEGGATVADVCDHILSLDDRALKQTLLADDGLRKFIRTRLSKTDAMLVASTLLDRSLFWESGSGPDMGNNFQIQATADFSRWILGRDENGPDRPDLLTGTMNCWEGVLFSMYVAGVVSYATLLEMHDRAQEAGHSTHAAGLETLAQDPEARRARIGDWKEERMVNWSRAQVDEWYSSKIEGKREEETNYGRTAAKQMGSDAYYSVLAEHLGAKGAKEWKVGDDPPPAGDIVFFTGVGPARKSQKWTVAHVCISLGRKTSKGTEIMNFGVSENGRTVWGCSTIEEALEHKYKSVDLSRYTVRYGPSRLLDA